MYEINEIVLMPKVNCVCFSCLIMSRYVFVRVIWSNLSMFAPKSMKESESRGCLIPRGHIC